MSRIWWCPTGPLAFLPIHAAGIYEQGNGLPGNFLSELAVSSYIPTVSVREASNSVDSCHDVPTGLLMVSQPNTPGMAKIPFARVKLKGSKSNLECGEFPHVHWTTRMPQSITYWNLWRNTLVSTWHAMHPSIQKLRSKVRFTCMMAASSCLRL